jgi:hypothetical protein
MPKLLRVEIRPGVYVKVPEGQADAEPAEAKKRPTAANKARRVPRSPDVPASKAERA